MAIARVVGRRIHQGAGKKGFGNARAVRNKVEEIIVNQSQRIGTMALRKEPVPEETLLRIEKLPMPIALGNRVQWAQPHRTEGLFVWGHPLKKSRHQVQALYCHRCGVRIRSVWACHLNLAHQVQHSKHH